eukprot:CAMPEP_0115004132 /NCGR_PEP_ID=MMETSP0216-20121206/19018_1 /TAXON_ID=223996 /ORGANISM="Protocruzia adherens, Strain Boccale" /LENGTH=377 /DNA_ID=CAMNT_0002370057 /DNA_START=9 /DNA_END=1142 /DNA_ORIENTATION=+
MSENDRREGSETSPEESSRKPPIFYKYAKIMKQSPHYESFIPRKFQSLQQMNDFHYNTQFLTSDVNLEFYNKLVPEIYYEMCDRSSNYFYASLILSMGEFLGVDPTDPEQTGCAKIATFSEMMHDTFVICDDFCDGSEFRDGKPSVYKMYGAPLSVLSCMQAWYQGQNMLLESFPDHMHADVLKTISHSFQNLAFAQGFDIGIKVHKYIPTEEEYINHSVNKFFTAHNGTQLLFMLKDADSEIRELVKDMLDNFGVAYTIRDDILNLIPCGLTKRKKVIGDEISEQKPTFLVVHSHYQAKNSDRLLEILRMGTRDEKLIREAIDIMELNGSFAYAREQSKKYLDRSLAALEKLKKFDHFGGHQALEKVIKYVACRDT